MHRLTQWVILLLVDAMDGNARDAWGAGLISGYESSHDDGYHQGHDGRGRGYGKDRRLLLMPCLVVSVECRMLNACWASLDLIMQEPVKSKDPFPHSPSHSLSFPFSHSRHASYPVHH